MLDPELMERAHKGDLEGKLMCMLDKAPSEVVVNVVKKYTALANLSNEVKTMLKAFKKLKEEDKTAFFKLAKEMMPECKQEGGHGGGHGGPMRPPMPSGTMEIVVEEVK